MAMKGWKTAGFTAGLLIISMFFSGCTQAADGNVMDGGDYILNDREGAVTEKDLSDKDAPKTVESTELEQFKLRFANVYGSYGLDEKWPSGFYNWNIKKQDGTYYMSLQVMASSYLEMNYQEVVEEDYIKGLAKLIQDMDLAQYNGYYMTDNANSYEYYLYARYRSDESILIRAEGKVSGSCVFDIPALMEYAALKAAPDKGEEEPTEGKTGENAEDALTQIMGHWRDEAGSKELWITEDTVTVKQGEYSKEYGYVLEEEDGRPRIASTEGYGYFGGMTKPVLREDGTLYAEEMLDDDSLVYRFVKTED